MYSPPPQIILMVVFLSIHAIARPQYAAKTFNKDSSAAAQYIRNFEDSSPAVRVLAMEQAAALGEPAAPFLGTALKSGPEQTRVLSAIALCRLKTQALPAVMDITAGLQDSSNVVRMHCAWSLRYFPELKGLCGTALRAAARDPDASVRKAAVLSLSIIDPFYLTDAPPVEEVIAKADSLIPILREQYHVPGVSAVILRNHQVVWHKSYGVADSRTSAPVTDETMFEACSMTKPVFSYLALLLMREYKIDLDSPVYRLYDDPAFMGQPERLAITPRMLLSHTSGLPNWRPGDEDNEGLLPVLFRPGLKFSYSGEGMFLLQRVLERVTGVSFEHTADSRLFGMLAMQHSSMVYKKEFEKFIAAGHNESGEFRRKTAYKRANAGFTLYCSALDYAKFILHIMRPPAAAITEEREAIVRQMLSRQVITASREPAQRPGRATGFDTWMGLGLGITATAGHDLFSHSGANDSGFRCYSQFNPEEGSGIVIMTNSLSGTALWEKVVAEIGDL